MTGWAYFDQEKRRERNKQKKGKRIIQEREEDIEELQIIHERIIQEK